MNSSSKSSLKQPDDFDLQALVDAQLGREEESWVWQEIEQNSRLRRRYEALVKQKRLLLQWWADEDPRPDAPSSERRETLLV